MSGIDEYFGFNEPEEKVEPKKELSLQERVNAISEIGPLSLGKTTDYFEETYKQIVPEPEPIQEQVIVEQPTPKFDLSSLSVEELEALAEEKTQEIEIEQIKTIAEAGMPQAWASSEPETILDSVQSYTDGLTAITKPEEEHEIVPLEERRIQNLEQRIVALANTMEGVKGYINEGTLVSGIGQGGDGQLPGGGEVLLRGLDDVNLNGLSDGDSLVWDELEGQF